jgi:hypothetical protein
MTRKSIPHVLFSSNVARLLFLVALCVVVLTLASVKPAAGAKLCCLDEWQGGGVCNPGYRLASQCSGPGCTNCGTFTCVPESTMCLR